ncbi:hypothetical protein WA158_001101 [Blastocystis sp. Blastoise]
MKSINGLKRSTSVMKPLTRMISCSEPPPTQTVKVGSEMITFKNTECRKEISLFYYFNIYIDFSITQEFDVLVIGGGCTGTYCAYDAAKRGLKVALVEQEDFASGTSSRSTNLLHGGIRYLEQAFTKCDPKSLALVWEALKERTYLLNEAPYLAKGIPTVMPLYAYWRIPYVWFGCKLYDFIAGKRSPLPGARFIGKKEIIESFPYLNENKLKGGILYYDGQHDDARHDLMIALTALQNGAELSNYVKNSENKLCGANVTDVLTGNSFDIKSHIVVNACGVFGDTIRKMDDPKEESLIIPASGTHIVIDRKYCPEGRGTTDNPSEITMRPYTKGTDVDFILNEANRLLNVKLTKDDVKSAFTGIRPLVRNPKAKNTAELVRAHLVHVSPSNLVTIVGGKWTTTRNMAEETINKVSELLSKKTSCSTKDSLLTGANEKKQQLIPSEISTTLRDTYSFPRDIADHLAHSYGYRAYQIADLAKTENLGSRLNIDYPHIEAEVVFSCRKEYCCTAIDYIARRSRLSFLDTKVAESVVDKVVSLMEKEIPSGFDVEKQKKDAYDYINIMKAQNTI